MERPSQLDLPPLGRSLIPFLLVAGACAASVVLGAVVATGDLTVLLAIGIAVCGVALFLVPTYWGILIYFTYSAFSPLLKYAASYNVVVHLGPTLVLAPIVLRWLGTRRTQGERRVSAKLPLAGLVVAFVVWSGLMIFAPLTTPVVALGGVITYVLPIVFFPMAFSELRTLPRIRGFLIMTFATSALGALLTLVFVAVGPQQVAKLGPGFAAAALIDGNHYIEANGHGGGYFPLSVVSSVGGYIVALLLLLALLVGRARLLGRIGTTSIAAPLLFVLMAAVVSSGVRVATAGMLIGIIAIVLTARRNALVPLLFAGIVGYLVLGTVGSLAGGGALARAATLLNPAAALTSSGRTSLLVQIGPMAVEHPFGYGMGRVGPGAATAITAAGADGNVSAIGFDNMLLAIMSELGDVGAVLLSAIAVLFAVRGWQVYRKLSDPTLKSIALGCTAASAALTATWIAGPILMQAPNHIYFWSLAGLCFVLPYVQTGQAQQAIDALTDEDIRA